MENKINKTNKLLLRELNNKEILSIKYEGCVLIKGNDVIKAGLKIDTLNTDDKIKTIWNDFLYDEYGTTNTETIKEIEGLI